MAFRRKKAKQYISKGLTNPWSRAEADVRKAKEQGWLTKSEPTININNKENNPYYKAKQGIIESILKLKKKKVKEQLDTPIKTDTGSSYANRTDSTQVGNGRDTGQNI